MASDFVWSAVDCQGLAGAWTLGTVQTERFEIIHRASLPGGFGDDAVRRNHDLLGSFNLEDGPSDDWEPQHGVAYVHGTPPCSGFSVYNTSKKTNTRGPDSPINSCMRDLVTYASRCTGADGRKGAEIVAFESVQGAFNQGRSLMQALRADLSERSGQEYDLTHVLMSGASVGNPQERKRYYFVAHRVPFGVDPPTPRKVVTTADAIADLEGLELQWEDQLYQRLPTDWAAPLHRSDGYVDAHMTREGTNRAVQLITEAVDYDWQPGEYFQDVGKRMGRARFEKYFPGRWNEDEEQPKGLPRHWPKRVRPDKPAWVVTGNSSLSFVHYSEPRFLTVRELTRLMGYPDDWRWPEGYSVDHVSSMIGKCCPVTSGQWVSDWVALALDGEPGQAGEKIGEHEYLHNSSLDYRRWPEEVSGWRLR